MEKVASQMHNAFTQMQGQALDAWRKSLEDQLGKSTAMLGRAAEMDAQSRQQATMAIDEWARLAKRTLEYQAELSAEWRKQSLEAMQRTMALFPFAAPPAAPAAPAKKEG